MNYSYFTLFVAALLVTGAVFPFSASAHHGDEYVCRVSYDGGRTSVLGHWQSEDKNRVCYTDQQEEVDSSDIEKRVSILNKEIKQKSNKILKTPNLFSRLRLSSLERKLNEREEKMIALAEISPSLFARNVFLEDEISKIPSHLKNIVEQPIQTSGEIWSVLVENFDNELPKYKYFLSKDNNQFNAFPPARIAENISERVVVRGYQLNNNIIITSLPNSNTLGAVGYATHSFGVLPKKRLAVFLLEYRDSPQRPFSEQQAHDLIFNGTVNDFFREQSYGRFEFTGDVFGWVPMNSVSSCIGNDPMLEIGSGKDIDQFIASNNIDLDTYDTVLFLGNCSMGTPTSGYASLGPRTYTVNNAIYQFTPAVVFVNGQQALQTSHTGYVRFSKFDHVVAHELGHTLGVAHANHYDCGADIFYVGCQSREYGNVFDTMGYGWYGAHFTASVKERLGWLLPREIITVTQNGTYTLAPLEVAGVGAKTLKIKIPGTNFSPYYVEFRKGIGFDDALNSPDLVRNQSGVLATRIHSGNAYGVSSLLDFSPGNPPGTFDMDLKEASLNPVPGLIGNFFNDSRNGIKIGPIVNIAQSAGAAPLIALQASVVPATCVRSAPVFRTGYSVNNYPAGYLPKFSPGETLTFFGWYLNADSLACSPAPFTFTRTVDPQWGLPPQVYAPVINSLLPESQAGFLDSSLTIPQGTMPSTYNVTIALTNDASGMTSSIVIPIEVE